MTGRSNFIVFFMGREGSSAIISMMSAQKGIQVPLFEDLDDRNFMKDHKAGDFPAVVSQIFRTGVYEGITRHPALFEPWPGNVESIGFKARLFTNPDALAPVLLENRVKVFVLARRDFTEFLASTYVNKMRPADEAEGPPSRFPQFGLRNMEAGQREKFLTSLDRLKLRVKMRHFIRESTRLARYRRRNVRYAERLADNGVEVIPIFYEDFLADRISFIRAMLKAIGFPADWPIRDQTGFTKVMISPARKKLEPAGFWLGQLVSLPGRLRYDSALRKLRRIGRKSRTPATVPGSD